MAISKREHKRIVKFVDCLECDAIFTHSDDYYDDIVDMVAHARHTGIFKWWIKFIIVMSYLAVVRWHCRREYYKNIAKYCVNFTNECVACKHSTRDICHNCPYNKYTGYR